MHLLRQEHKVLLRFTTQTLERCSQNLFETLSQTLSPDPLPDHLPNSPPKLAWA